MVEWGGTEPLTVPRHTAVREVRSYVRLPRGAGRVAPVARFAAPAVRLLGRLGPPGPGERRRRKTRFAVVAEARGRERARRARLIGTDVYGLTALIVARGAEALTAGEVASTGVLAPAEAFEAASFVAKLGPLLERPSVDEL